MRLLAEAAIMYAGAPMSSMRSMRLHVPDIVMHVQGKLIAAFQACRGCFAAWIDWARTLTLSIS